MQCCIRSSTKLRKTTTKPKNFFKHISNKLTLDGISEGISSRVNFIYKTKPPRVKEEKNSWAGIKFHKEKKKKKTSKRVSGRGGGASDGSDVWSERSSIFSEASDVRTRESPGSGGVAGNFGLGRPFTEAELRFTSSLRNEWGLLHGNGIFELNKFTRPSNFF